MRIVISTIVLLRTAALAAPAADKYDTTAGNYEQMRLEHWAFQPIQADASAGSIDQYILAELSKAGLKPAKASDRRRLIRRATFDLAGLPPTPEAVEAFVNDSSENAFEKVV